MPMFGGHIPRAGGSSLTRAAHARAYPRASARAVHDFVRGATPGGMYKVPLKSPKIVGVESSRGSRLYQEDATAVHALTLDPRELVRSIPRGEKWEPASAGPSVLAGQVAFFGIYDGHGGRAVSSFLHDNLHELVETVSPSDIDQVVSDTVAIGGYFRRWRGGALQRWTEWGGEHRAKDGDVLSVEERVTLAFLKADLEVQKQIGEAERCGSTASVVLVHSLDEPGQPHWASKRVHLTVAQCGDTRVILCDRRTGMATPLSERHHAEARVEADRLRRMGADRLVADSFGETRWMGAIENTRGFGDFEWKPSGVTAEPEVVTRVIDGAEHAYLVLVTDGLTSLLSDQEIVDLARRAADPTRAAKTIVHFGEDLGAQDNCTCVVVPLAGWGQVGGEDTTEARREYRRHQAGMLNTRMQRM